MAKKEQEIVAIPQKEERNMGVELFRIVSMILVVMLHVIGHGGVYSYAPKLSDTYKVAWFLYTMAYCCVNCYAMISGYANVKSNFKFRKMVHLWLEVVTLNLGLTLAMHFFVPGAVIETDYWWKAVFPLTMRALWYVCAYFFMFPLIPILNKGLLSLKKYQHIAIIFLLQMPTIFRLIMKTDNYVLGSGYSALWLICLYVIGAYFRIYGAPKWAKWYVTLPTFFLATYIAWSYRMNIETQYVDKLIEKDSELYTNRGILISYISPCMVVMAVALMMFFMQVKIKRKIPKVIIANLAKATFGVFVLHVGAAFWYYTDFWKKFNAYGKLPPSDMVFAVIGTALAIYLVASAISLARIYLFKLLKVNKAIDFFADLPSKIQERKEQSKLNKYNKKAVKR